MILRQQSKMDHFEVIMCKALAAIDTGAPDWQLTLRVAYIKAATGSIPMTGVHTPSWDVWSICVSAPCYEALGTMRFRQPPVKRSTLCAGSNQHGNSITVLGPSAETQATAGSINTCAQTSSTCLHCYRWLTDG